MRFDYSKTINEQLPTFEYYKNRYACYELEIMNLQQENQQLKKDAEFEKAYARSLRKIIYKLYMDIELSTGEFATLRQAIEENEVTND